MNRVEAITKWLFRPKPVLEATYEELFSDKYLDSDAYPELVRRLKPIVKAMAECDDPGTAEEVTNGIFAEFAPQFQGSIPESGLLRLAYVIRRRIGADAFYAGGQARAYYAQLALYHMSDGRLRMCLEFQFQHGLRRAEDQDFTGELAAVLRVQPGEVEELSQRAWRQLCNVSKQKFDSNNWKIWAEGHLPWPC